MIKNIVFDCSDTLLRFDAPAWFATLTGDAQRAQHIVTAIMKSPVWYRYDNGVATAQDVEREVLPLLDVADHDLAAHYIAHWIEHYTPIDGMPQLVADLKAHGYRLFLLSDFPDCFPRLAERFDFFALFDGMTVSYRAHCSKRDNGALFDHLLQEQSLRAEECAFVDDLPPYIELARARGIRAHLAADAKTLADWIATL
jgi:putative hydrolase of the HAD superfamily